MKLYVFARRDKKLGAYDVPYFKVEDVEHETESICRGLKFISKPEEIARAADFALYYLGIFDDVKGEFELLDKFEKLLDFEDYLPRKDDLKDGESK